MSDPNLVSVTERAFQLARTGTCRTVDDIRRHLARERYEAINQHLAGRSIQAQLKKLLAERAGPLDV
jgi:glucose-6-phosphate-specific signal transduction histidine kinase